jgi:choline dehydrogenase-like flavoprotein
MCTAWPCLCVADISILPDCLHAKTNVVTLMLGERLADGSRQEI